MSLCQEINEAYPNFYSIYPVVPLSESSILPCILEVCDSLLTAISEGVPHTSMNDDTYQGMRIPADSIIIPNVWSALKLYYQKASSDI